MTKSRLSMVWNALILLWCHGDALALYRILNTLRPRQMDAISQTTFSNAFSWMKMFEFRLKFHWRLFLRFQITIFQHWFRYWLGAVQATSHYLNQWWLVYWRIYASPGLNELMTCFDLIFLWFKITLTAFVTKNQQSVVLPKQPPLVTETSKCIRVCCANLLTCAPRRSIVLQFFWSARKCL